MATSVTGFPTGARPRPRHGARLAVVATVVLLLLLLLAATVRAAAPGKLLYAKRIGSGLKAEAAAWALAAAPHGATVLGGCLEKKDIRYPMVAKHTAAGKRAWLKTYTKAGDGDVEDVAVDRAGNVYAAATVDMGTSPDILVLKYSAKGALRWARTYDNEDSGFDTAEELAVDRRGDVVVLGRSNLTGLPGIVVLKYKANGMPAWPEPVRWDPDPGDPDAGDSWVADLALDGKGDIFVAGSVTYMGFENAIVRKVLADGTKPALSGNVYEPQNGDSSSFDELTVRGADVVATGSIWTKGVDGSENALVVKYGRDLTQKHWQEWGVGNTSEEWFGQAVMDAKGNVFVTGEQWVSPVWAKAVTMKLNATLSKVLWVKRYVPRSKDAGCWLIARGGAGDLYVAGMQNAHVGQPRYLTIKYSPSGARKWVRTWVGGKGVEPGGGEPTDLVLGAKDGVYVGGFWALHAVKRAVLLKYKK